MKGVEPSRLAATDSKSVMAAITSHPQTAAHFLFMLLPQNKWSRPDSNRHLRRSFLTDLNCLYRATSAEHHHICLGSTTRAKRTRILLRRAGARCGNRIRVHCLEGRYLASRSISHKGPLREPLGFVLRSETLSISTNQTRTGRRISTTDLLFP